MTILTPASALAPDALEHGQVHPDFGRSSVRDFTVDRWRDYSAVKIADSCEFCTSNKRRCFVHPNNPACLSCTTYGSLCSHSRTANEEVTRTLAKGASVSKQIGTTSVSPVRKSTRLSREASKTFQRWYSAHQNDPYPDPEERYQLAIRTGSTAQQVYDWFCNARRRQQKGLFTPDRRSMSKKLPEQESFSKPIPIPVTALRIDSDPILEDLNPLERWKNSPPDQEPIPPAVIEQAILALNDDEDKDDQNKASRRASDVISGSSIEEQFPLDDPDASVESDSIAWSTGSRTSFASIHSASSFGSFATPSPFTNGQRRRRHRKIVVRKKDTKKGFDSPQSRPSSRIRPSMEICWPRFQCTFCGRDFQKKHDWARHEVSVHVPIASWECGRSSGPPQDQAGITQSPEYLVAHKFQPCWQRSSKERTFTRKDNLRQHLKVTHGCSYEPWMDTWERRLGDIKSTCGFCALTLRTWDERVEHLASHFEEGYTMDSWEGWWGFDPEVDQALEGTFMKPSMLSFEESPLKVHLRDYMDAHFDKCWTFPNDTEIEIEGSMFLFGFPDRFSAAADPRWRQQLPRYTSRRKCDHSEKHLPIFPFICSRCPQNAATFERAWLLQEHESHYHAPLSRNVRLRTSSSSLENRRNSYDVSKSYDLVMRDSPRDSFWKLKSRTSIGLPPSIPCESR